MAEDLRNELYDALSSGDIDQVRAVLDRGANANDAGDPTNPGLGIISPLLYYLEQMGGEGEEEPPNIEIIRLLLDRGANPSGHPGEDPPLAFVMGYPDIFGLLLERGANPNAMYAGSPLIHDAVTTKNADAVRALLDRGADMNAPDPTDSGVTPLERATVENLHEIVRLLLERGADANAPGTGARDPPFITAVASQSPEMIRIFLERGANPNMVSKRGIPAMHHAILPLSIQALRAGGGDINVRNPRGETPLTSLLKKRAQAYTQHAARALIEAGADPNLPNTAGETPLFLAVRITLPLVILSLLSKGADPKTVSRDGVHHAIFYILSMFLEVADDETNRMIANQYEAIILAMIEGGVNPDVRGPDNDTLLHILVQHARSERILDLIQELIRLRLNPNAISDDGMTPLENLAYTGGRNADRLVAMGFDPNFRNPDGTTILHRIANRPFGPGHQDPEQLAKAIKNASAFPGIDVNVRNTNGETPLHIAARRNNVLVVSALLNVGADATLRVEGDGAEGPRAIDLTTSEDVKSFLRGYPGRSRETMGLFHRIFENPANVSICPVCLAYADREDGCRYMSHVCKLDERIEELYERFRGRAAPYKDRIEWCTECGRICDNHHRHYNLTPHTERRPGLAPIVAERAPQAHGVIVHYLPDCRPSGGGGLEEKFLRFYQMIRTLEQLQSQVEGVRDKVAKDKAIIAAWNGPFDTDRTPEEQVIRTQLRELAGLLRAPPAPGAPAAEVDEWNARVLSLKSFGANMELFPEEAPPVASAEVPVPEFPRPEADRELLPIRMEAPAPEPGAAAAGPVGTFCLAEAGPHDDGRPTFRLRHRQPDGRDYTHPPGEAICGEDLVRLINVRRFTGKCPINTATCQADIHPDELDAFGDQIPEQARQNYRSKYNRLKAGLLAVGGRRKTYRKKSRHATGRRQRGGKININALFRKMDENEYTCSVGAL